MTISAPPLPRDEFPTTRRWAYLNHAGMGPIPLPAVNAMVQRAMELACDGELAWDEHKANVERVRALGARLMGVPSADVAFIKNTTEGLGFVANGLPWRAGDRVVVSDLDFRRASTRGWRSASAACASISCVPRAPGRRCPARPSRRSSPRARRRRSSPPAGCSSDAAGAWTCRRSRTCPMTRGPVLRRRHPGAWRDPAELERWGVDFAMADGHKWLLGPQGTGLLYVRAARRDLLRPLEPGWNAMRHREQWDELALAYDDSARRFEGGMPNIIGIAGLGGSLGLLLEAGVHAIWAHVDALLEHACAGLSRLGATVLSERGGDGRSGIVSCTLAGHDASALGTALRARGFACGARSGALRIAPHGYNNTEEIDRLLHAIAELTAGGRSA